MVVVVSPRWEYWDEVVTVRVTLQEVSAIAMIIAQNSKQNAVRVIKCFVIFVLFFKAIFHRRCRVFDIRYLRSSVGSEYSFFNFAVQS